MLLLHKYLEYLWRILMAISCKTCGFTKDNTTDGICPVCKSNNWIDSDIISLKRISDDENFIEAMLALKEKDPIEFQLKLAQFKATTVQQESVKSQEQNIPKCPTCGSTNIKKISAGNRWLSTGLFGISSSKLGKSIECRHCGYKW